MVLEGQGGPGSCPIPESSLRAKKKQENVSHGILKSSDTAPRAGGHVELDGPGVPLPLQGEVWKGPAWTPVLPQQRAHWLRLPASFPEHVWALGADRELPQSGPLPASEAGPQGSAEQGKFQPAKGRPRGQAG